MRATHIPMQDAVVRARVDSELKRDTEKVFERLGLTTTEAIRLFLAQVKLREGLPFEVRIPTDNRDVLLSPASRQSALDSVSDD
ncbi:type II toxin-antitoxin system antitoxin, RelB/DinJ family [candidate division KSB3 bacterium]|uniref:Type II toxin-antitoxin system antitoxin, RelB/DinJ family n=1 Tax=candidate division KSB3 bacterium TaxID=2044937 RepID=A0A2G6E0A8_9BACT|nr:MAG: type II toxin-antitoxin system antitoxin, RelB/DinJ family [candidate division KSB3 bacterium]